MNELTWPEVDRGATALSVWVFELGLPLNPEDAEELVRAILHWSKSSASTDEIIDETKRRLDLYRKQMREAPPPPP
jgi:hypothetical protein